MVNTSARLLRLVLKVHQALPTRIFGRLGELDAAFTHTARPDEGQISPALLLRDA